MLSTVVIKKVSFRGMSQIFLQQQAKGEEKKNLAIKGSKWYETGDGVGALSLSRWQPRAGAARRSSGRPTRLAALPFSTRAPARGGPLSAGLQVLVREHVELAVQPTGFIPAEKWLFCNTQR